MHVLSIFKNAAKVITEEGLTFVIKLSLTEEKLVINRRRLRNSRERAPTKAFFVHAQGSRALIWDCFGAGAGLVQGHEEVGVRLLLDPPQLRAAVSRDPALNLLSPDGKCQLLTERSRMRLRCDGQEASQRMLSISKNVG